MHQIVTKAVWCFLSSWSVFIVWIKITQNYNASLGSLVLLFVKGILQNPSHPQYTLPWWFLVRLKFLQHTVHHVVLDLLLFGWIKMFSVFQGHLTFKNFLAPFSGRTGDQKHTCLCSFSGKRSCQSPSQTEFPELCHLCPSSGPVPGEFSVCELANMLLLLWLLSYFVFVRSRFLGGCCSCALCFDRVCVHVPRCVLPRIFSLSSGVSVEMSKN